MGGPGIVISREVLRRIGPNIQYCLKHLYSTHEDVEVGRCIGKFARVTCAWSYEVGSSKFGPINQSSNQSPFQ